MSDPEPSNGGSAIEQLDETTIEQIAAGEVVERPASVVKELVENSLDADATEIQLHVDAGGKDLLRIRDDGIGMTAADLRQAVKQHTTSKLRRLQDLQEGIGSYGFRGEALHAIGTVSRLTIASKSRDASSRGHRISMAGGEVGSIEPAGCPVGTTVEVTDLFYNTPARREFLGTDDTEFDHVNRIATHYALANPDVAVALHHDGREVFRTPGRGDRMEAVLAVYGREVAKSMYDVDETFEEGGVTRVRGVVSDPEVTRSRPRYLSTFVNDRYVRAKPIRDGILDAYDRRLAPDRYPFAVISCEIDGAAVDVNVHPRKLEVRFEDPAAIEQAVNAAVAAALCDAGLGRTTAPRGPGRPAESDVTPEPSSQPDGSESTEPLTRGVSTGDSSSPPSTSSAGRHSSAPSGERSGDAEPADRSPLATPRAPERKFRGPTEQSTVGEATPDHEFDRLPPLDVLGQLRDTFIVAECPDGLLLVDQHAADERVAYERLRAAVAEDDTTQQLMHPVTVELTSDEAAAYPRVVAALEELGFGTAEDASGGVRVESVPAVFDRPIEPDRVRDAISAAVDETSSEDPVDAIATEVLADLACDPAVTGNTRLSEGSIVDLLVALDGCENPYECPHGRPVVISIDEDELAARFERTYPGHATRRDE